ncbi:MAG: hypothetical protein ACF8Q5_12275 [Phycisphaerales bacterium JB040]
MSIADGTHHSDPRVGKTRRFRTRARALLALVGATALLPGCSSRISFNPGATPDTPPLAIETADGVIDVTLQAPNPGWTISAEGSKRSADGPRVLVTVTRPDPGLLYPQVIAEKTVRTNQPPTPGSRVWARVLDHDQRPPAHHVPYAPTDLLVTDPATDP